MLLREKSTVKKILYLCQSQIFLKNLKLKNIRLSSKNNFSFNLSKKLKVSDLKLISKINLKKAEYDTEESKN